MLHAVTSICLHNQGGKSKACRQAKQETVMQSTLSEVHSINMIHMTERNMALHAGRIASAIEH